LKRLKEDCTIVRKIKTIIVDDEPHARRLIRTLLEGEADFEIAAECGDGAQAIEAIEKLEPDLVFLDVQMPEIDGFAVIDALDDERLPVVVFVTAYDQYAVKAFDVHALDYLLKPFDSDRFGETLARIRTAVGASGDGAFRERLVGLLKDVSAGRRPPERLLVKSGGRITFVPVAEIDWIEASGNYLHIHRGGEMHLMRQTMTRMESLLDPQRFVRIHRSTIVNLDRIKELQPSLKGEFEVILDSGARLILSRTYRPVLEERLGRQL
jgi:two-component system LytT family response regulator